MIDQKTILVLEDCEDLLALEKFMIEKLCERRAVLARNLDEVKALGQESLGCEMALLDINLGPNEPNGVAAYQWLRANGFERPIYFLSGHASSLSAVAGVERSGDAKILQKPVDPHLLMRIIRGDHEG